jgi:hypothetical protein
MLVEGPYLILFETRPDTDEGQVDQVEIVRVVDGRRDLTQTCFRQSRSESMDSVSFTLVRMMASAE